MLNKFIAIGAISACIFVAALAAGSPVQAATPTDPVLLQYKGIAITKSDLQNLIDLQIPTEKRAQVWSNQKLLRQLIADLFITRQLAKEARAAGLEHKDRWQVSYLNSRALMFLQLKSVVAQNMKNVDLAGLARDAYDAHPKRFHVPEKVRVEHILISTKNRSDQQALARAKMVLAKVRAHPNQFATLADKYSDDPSVKNNHGDLGFFSRKQVVKPFADAAFAMTKPGQIAGPVKTRFGYHIIRFEARRQAHTKSFAEVRSQLIAEQKKKMEQKFKEQAVSQVKSLKGITVNQDAIQALVRRLPNMSESKAK